MATTTSSPTGCPAIELTLPGAVAFSTLRGCSDAGLPYDGFNICGYTGDDPRHTASCRLAAAARLGLSDPSLLITPRQTHSLRVAIVDRSHAGLSPDETDALVTTDSGVAIGVSTADCVPVVMCDPEAAVIAAVHSGWRGTIGRICARAVDTMVSLGSRRERIWCALGPYIHVGSYEVGADLAGLFAAEFGSLDGLTVATPGKPHLDLGVAVRAVLRDAGIDPDHVTEAGICSYADYGRVFSARRLGVASGRTLTAARLPRLKASI